MAMSATPVAANLAFRARVARAPGVANAVRVGALSCDPRRDSGKMTRRVRLAARADASPAAGKKAEPKKSTVKKPDARKDDAKEAKKHASEATTVTSDDRNAKDTSEKKKTSEKTIKEPPAPPAAPAGYEKDIKRLEKLGVEVHNFGTSYLDDGTNDAHVRELQRFLKGTGHYDYKDGPTGYFGPMTSAAVKRWQKKYGLPESGGWGAQSRATYLQVKHAEARAMRDPEAAARWAKSAAANGLVNKNTGLPVPPSIGGTAGEAAPSWVASANVGSSVASPSSIRTPHAEGVPGGVGSRVALALLAVGLAAGAARRLDPPDGDGDDGDGDGDDDDGDDGGALRETSGFPDGTYLPGFENRDEKNRV